MKIRQLFLSAIRSIIPLLSFKPLYEKEITSYRKMRFDRIK